jgi:hypothetical protein
MKLHVKLFFDQKNDFRWYRTWMNHSKRRVCTWRPSAKTQKAFLRLSLTTWTGSFVCSDTLRFVSVDSLLRISCHSSKIWAGVIINRYFLVILIQSLSSYDFALREQAISLSVKTLTIDLSLFKRAIFATDILDFFVKRLDPAISDSSLIDELLYSLAAIVNHFTLSVCELFIDMQQLLFQNSQ